MTQTDKELLLKDLCARLPYNPLVEYEGEDYNVLGIAHRRLVLCKPLMSHTLNENPRIEEVKPYLLPMSSMTKEQEDEWDDLYIKPLCERLNPHTRKEDLMLRAKAGYAATFWLMENHFDYLGLIPMGLAKDATNLNIY